MDFRSVSLSLFAISKEPLHPFLQHHVSGGPHCPGRQRQSGMYRWQGLDLEVGICSSVNLKLWKLA